jgi:hypothetical protein
MTESMRRLLGITCLVVAAACGTGDDTMTEDECGPTRMCPQGFECHPVDRRCVTIVAMGVKLSLTIDGGGSVTVSGAPASCTSASCSFDFTSGTSVTLTAQATSGKRFVRWGGACSGTATSVNVTMDAAKSCTATFVDRLAVSGAVSGATGGAIVASSSDEAASCAGASCTIDRGGSVTLTAPTIAGSRFTGWTGTGCSGSTPVLSLTSVAAPLTCTATYAPGIAVIGSVVGATGTVAATSTSSGATCSNGGCSVDVGASVTLTAPTITGHRFTGWSGDPECTGTAAALTVTNVTRSVSCSANYVGRFTVSVTVSGAATTARVSSTDATAVCTGGTQCVVDAQGKARLEVDPVAGHRFAGWSGGCAGSDNPLLLTSITSDRACVANFAELITVSGTVAGGPTAPVAASSTDAFRDCSAGNACVIDEGGSAILLAPTAVGYRFSGWSGGTGCSGAANPLLLTNVAASTACVATFVPRVTVTGVVAGVTAEAEATSTDPFSDCAAGDACTVDTGGSVTLSVDPQPGLTFGGWSGAGCPLSTELSITLGAVTQNRTCTATWISRVTITVLASGAQPQILSAESSAPGAVCDGNTCTVDAGSAVTLQVGEVDAMRFVGWTGTPCAGMGLGTFAELVVTESGTCTAHYVPFESTVRPVLVNPWSSPTQWRDVDGNAVRMGVQPVSQATFQCRTGRTEVDLANPSHLINRPWLPCDGALGATTTVIGIPVPGDENGSYATEVRLRIVEYQSEEVAHPYYAHNSLDGAARCPTVFADDLVYKAVKEFTPPGLGSPLPTSLQFSTSTDLELPFATLVFVRARYNSFSTVRVNGVDPAPANPLFQSVLSLRHTFTLSPDRTMLFVKRAWQSRRPGFYGGTPSCRNSFEFGWQEISGVAPCWDGESCTGDPLREMEHCDTLVLNATGAGVCIQSVSGNPRPQIYSVSAWRKVAHGTKNLSPKRLKSACTGTARDCEVSLYLPP